MRIACWTPKATDIRSGYVILVATKRLTVTLHTLLVSFGLLLGLSVLWLPQLLKFIYFWRSFYKWAEIKKKSLVIALTSLQLIFIYNIPFGVTLKYTCTTKISITYNSDNKHSQKCGLSVSEHFVTHFNLQIFYKQFLVWKICYWISI
jgi:hypothetical protein